MKQSIYLAAAVCFFLIAFTTGLSALETTVVEKAADTQETVEVEKAIETQEPATVEKTAEMVEKTAEMVETVEIKPATVSVVEALICRNIVDHNPSEPGESFEKETAKLYCFSRMSSDAKTEIKHIWYKNDIAVADISLNIGTSTGWRTFSSKNIRPIDTGNWKVEIVDAENKVLSTNTFTVSE